MTKKGIVFWPRQSRFLLELLKAIQCAQCCKTRLSTIPDRRNQTWSMFKVIQSTKNTCLQEAGKGSCTHSTRIQKMRQQNAEAFELLNLGKCSNGQKWAWSALNKYYLIYLPSGYLT
jgi:hypothetical protein